MAKFQSLIVVSHGRTGSTLLQGILNTAPGFIIRGENAGFIGGFQVAFRRLERAQNNPIAALAHASTHPYYGIRAIKTEKFLAGLSRVVRNALVPADQRDQVVCYGFKEIRYPLTDPEFTDYMAFLRKLMPDLAIVLNTRDHEKTARSGWYAKRPTAELIKTLADADAIRLAYVARNPDHAFHIRYEDVIARGPQLQELFDFLGATYLPEKIVATLETPHGGMKKRKRHRKQTEEPSIDDEPIVDEDIEGLEP